MLIDALCACSGDSQQPRSAALLHLTLTYRGQLLIILQRIDERFERKAHVCSLVVERAVYLHVSVCVWVSTGWRPCGERMRLLLLVRRLSHSRAARRALSWHVLPEAFFFQRYDAAGCLP